MRFLADHRRCGHGFDLDHPGGPGSGNLQARCRGCGAEIRYVAGEDEPQATAPEASHEPARVTNAEQPVSGVAVPVAPRRAWRSPVAMAAVACLALATAVGAFAALRSGDRHGAEPGAGVQAAVSPETGTAQSAAQPSVATPPLSSTKNTGNRSVNGVDSATTADTPTSSASNRGNKGGARRAPVVRRTLAANGPSVSVPGSWDVNFADGGYVLSPSGSSQAAVRVYFEHGTATDGDTLRSQTHDLLAKEHPDATFTTEGPLIPGSDGTTTVATYDGGVERGQAVVDNGLTIVVLARADSDAEPALQGQVLAIAASVHA